MNPRTLRRAAGIALLFPLSSLPLLAQEAADPKPAEQAAPASPEAGTLPAVKATAQAPTPYTAKETTAATRLPLTLKETPQSVTVFTRDRIDDQNLQTMREVLDNTTGVYSYAYDTERVLFTARGFVIDNMLYDNVPASTVFSTGSVDENIDTSMYERIEITRGATGLLSGAGSPSAAINLVRKHADSRSFEAATSLTASSWDDYRAVADLSTPLAADGDVRARVVASYQDRESFQDLYSKEHEALYATVAADLGPNTLLTLGYDYLETKPQGNTWGSFPLFFSDGTRTDWRRSITTATNWSFWDKRSETQFAELEQRVGEWSIRSTLTHRRFSSNLALFYVYGFPDPVTGEGLEPYAYRSRENGQMNSLDVYATGPFQLFGRRHELVVGSNTSRLKTHGYEYNLPDGTDLPDIGNFFEWDGSYPMPAFPSAGLLITDITTDQRATYAAARWSLADPLKLITGLRYTYFKTDYYDIYSDPDNAFVYEHKPVTPYAGLVYDLSPQWAAFTSYTGIFKPQNNLTRDARMLDPIDGESFEIGIKGEHFGGKLNTALTLFETRQDNVAVADPEIDPSTGFPYTVNGRPNLAASVEVDGTRSRGLELEASGQLAPGWNLSFGASWFELEGPDGEEIRRYVPRTLVRSYTSWTPRGAWNKLTLGGGVNWQSKSTAEGIGTPTGVTNIEQGAVTLVSLLARYQFTPEVSVQLNGSNLLDKTYYVLDEYGNLYYGTPASGALTVSFRF